MEITDNSRRNYMQCYCESTLCTVNERNGTQITKEVHDASIVSTVVCKKAPVRLPEAMYIYTKAKKRPYHQLLLSYAHLKESCKQAGRRAGRQEKTDS